MSRGFFRSDFYRTWRAPIAVVLVGSFLTFATTMFIQNRNQAEADARFLRISQNFSVAVKTRLASYVNSLIYTRNLFDIKPMLREAEFSKFIQRMDFEKNLPGIQTVGYVKVYSRNEGLRFLNQIGKTSDDAKIETTSGPLHLVKYVETIEKPARATAYGMDLRSNEIRRVAMETATDLGEPVATDRTLPYSSSHDQYLFLVFVPHYKNNMPTSTIEERRKAIAGFVYGVFKFSSLFSRVNSDMRMQKMGIVTEVFDGTGISQYQKAFMEGDNERAGSLVKMIPISQYNHSWTLKLTAPKDFRPPYSSWVPNLILIVGLISTLFLFVVTYRSQRIALQLEKDIQDRQRTEAQLRSKNELVDFTSKVGLSLMAEKDLSSLVQMVTDEGTRLVGAKFGAFFYDTVNESGEAMKLYSLSGASPEIFKKFGMPRKTEVFKPSFDGHGILRSDDITQDPRYGKNKPLKGMPEGHLPVRSYLSAPVISKSGKVLGVLLFGHPEPAKFNERSEKIVHSIAIQASIAMENAALYKQLNAARQEADAANHAKTMFLANISHEMRTPLGIMIGHAELALEEKDPKKMREAFEIIVRNGRDLTQIIGDVLDLSKIEANALQIDEVSVNTKTLIEDLQAGWIPKAEAKGLNLTFKVDPNVPSKFKTDRTRAKQILVNLLSNALKFTEKGVVKLHLSFDEKSQLIFSVEDSGHGISEKNKAKLFKIFSQGDSSITRKFGGNGLGLALSKQLAQALRGELYLENSQEGVGSRFVFKLPYHPADEAGVVAGLLRQEELEVLKGRRVLIVDDSPDNQVLVKMMLNKVGMISDLANNGEEGVQLALDSDYDLILMDLQMPVLDGYGALAKLRASGLNKPIVAVSAHALKEEKNRAISKGFNAYLTKPIDQQAFFSTLFELR